MAHEAEIIKEEIAIPDSVIKTTIVEKITESAEGAVKLEDTVSASQRTSH